MVDGNVLSSNCALQCLGRSLCVQLLWLPQVFQNLQPNPQSPQMACGGGGGEGVGVCMQPDLGRELPSYSELTWSSLRTVAHSSPVFLADSTTTLFPLTFTGGPQSSPDAATK